MAQLADSRSHAEGCVFETRSGTTLFPLFLAILNKQIKELIIAWSYNEGGGGSRPFLSGCHRNQKGLDRTDTDVGGQRRRLVDISGH